jgi:hypothetical protein
MLYHEQNKKSKDNIISNIALTIVFFLGKILPNVNLKNMILTYAKDISWKKCPKFSRFLWELTVGSQEYRRILGFSLSYLVCNQIRLNISWMMSFSYITKLKIRTLTQTRMFHNEGLAQGRS